MKISIITATYNRTECLASIALPSILNQVDRNFEWIVINDGGNQKTKDVIIDITAHFPIVYLEMEHPSTGFGLCSARNLGLDAATGDLVTYLDDDNQFASEFVTLVRQLFQQYPHVKYSMVRQHRRRDMVKDGDTIRQGRPFISPGTRCNIWELIRQQEIFDSNGFAHYRADAPRWNPAFKVFADYEYLLQCTSIWGNSAFQLALQVLVNYFQSSEGIIGSSTYAQWAAELEAIAHNYNCYAALRSHDVKRLHQLIQMYQSKASSQPVAFV